MKKNEQDIIKQKNIIDKSEFQKKISELRDQASEYRKLRKEKIIFRCKFVSPNLITEVYMAVSKIALLPRPEVKTTNGAERWTFREMCH